MSDLDTARQIVDRWLEMSFQGKWLTTQGYIQAQRVNLETLIVDALQDAQRNGEELGALDCPTHADHIAAMHDQLKCSCNYDRKGDVCAWHADMIAKAAR